MVGRPKKYKEKLQVISIALEPSFISVLEYKAKQQGMSRNEYITALLISADESTAKTLLTEFSELKRVIQDQHKTLKGYSEQLEKLGRLNMEQYLFKQISEREDLKELVLKHKERIQRALARDSEIPISERVEAIANDLFSEYELVQLKYGIMVTKKNEIKAVIKHLILSFLSF